MEPLPENVTIAGREDEVAAEGAQQGAAEVEDASGQSEAGADPGAEARADAAAQSGAQAPASAAPDPEEGEAAQITPAETDTAQVETAAAAPQATDTPTETGAEAPAEEATDAAEQPASEEISAEETVADETTQDAVESTSQDPAMASAPRVSELKSTTPPDETVLGGGAEATETTGATAAPDAPETAEAPEAAETQDAGDDDTRAPAPLEDTGLFTEVAPEDMAPETPQGGAESGAEDAPTDEAQASVLGSDQPTGEDTELALATPPAGLPKTDIVTDRLPRIGDEGAAPAPAALSASKAAIDRNAIAFTDPGDAPKMSLVLLDTGPERSSVGDLSLLPFPLTVAVDASRPDAEEAIAFYRKAGAEVVVIVPLPEGATATDVDVTFQAYAPLLEQAVAVMMEESLGFQSLGPGAAQVVTNLEEQGLGLISYQQGLNTAHKLAQKEEVPAGQIFTDLDGEGQSGAVIRRFLDNVAFKARNAEGVVALARVTPESVQALLEWSLGNRAQSVVLAPVSKTLPR